MANPPKLSQQILGKISTWSAFDPLFFGVVALSFGSIFIKWSEDSLSPNATVFNRFWLATVAFGLWRGGKAIRHSPKATNLYKTLYRSKSVAIARFWDFFCCYPSLRSLVADSNQRCHYQNSLRSRSSCGFVEVLP